MHIPEIQSALLYSLRAADQTQFPVQQKEIRTLPHIAKRLFCHDTSMVFPAFQILRTVYQHQTPAVFISCAKNHIAAVLPANNLRIPDMSADIGRIILIAHKKLLGGEMKAVPAGHMKGIA